MPMVVWLPTQRAHSTAENQVTIMFALNKGILSPHVREAGSFEKCRKKPSRKRLRLMWMTGNNPKLAGWSPCFVCNSYRYLLLGLRSKKENRREKKARISPKVRLFRDIPNEGNLSATYALGECYDIM
jgi:outer membrane phospholipase A